MLEAANALLAAFSGKAQHVWRVGSGLTAG